MFGMDAFYCSRIDVGTLLAFIGILSCCDNIPTQCMIDHQVRSSITLLLVMTIPNHKEHGGIFCSSLARE